MDTTCVCHFGRDMSCAFCNTRDEVEAEEAAAVLAVAAEAAGAPAAPGSSPPPQQRVCKKIRHSLLLLAPMPTDPPGSEPEPAQPTEPTRHAAAGAPAAPAGDPPPPRLYMRDIDAAQTLEGSFDPVSRTLEDPLLPPNTPIFSERDRQHLHETLLPMYIAAKKTSRSLTSPARTLRTWLPQWRRHLAVDASPGRPSFARHSRFGTNEVADELEDESKRHTKSARCGALALRRPSKCAMLSVFITVAVSVAGICWFCMGPCPEANHEETLHGRHSTLDILWRCPPAAPLLETLTLLELWPAGPSNPIALSPAFSPQVFSYTTGVVIPASLKNVQVKPTLNATAHGTVTVDGKAVGVLGSRVTLTDPKTTITVVVTDARSWGLLPQKTRRYTVTL